MINTESFIKRLEIILDYYSLNASSFADKIGVQRSSMSHLLSGRNKPSLDFMLKIMEVFPEVDLYWMLNGKGTFPKSEVVFESKSSPSTPIQSNTISETKIEKSIELNPENFSKLSPVLEENHLETISNSKIASTQKTDGEIDRIVIFYTNGTFKTYSPE